MEFGKWKVELRGFVLLSLFWRRVENNLLSITTQLLYAGTIVTLCQNCSAILTAAARRLCEIFLGVFIEVA